MSAAEASPATGDGEPPRTSPLAAADSLSRDNPWPGLASFAEADRAFFRGREAETGELLRLVRRETLTVLFGRSGLGKTSLLRAGVFPALRAEYAVPIYLRIDHVATAHPVRQVLTLVHQQAAASGIEAPTVRAGDTLWEYFHRVDEMFLDRDGSVVTAVLVFDQFEELFTLGRGTPARAQRTRELLGQLSDLIQGRAPAELRKVLDADPEAALRFDFSREIYRVVFSLREDFLPDLEDLKPQMPSINNRMRLKRMTGDQALQAVLAPGPDVVTSDAAEAIVRSVAGEPRRARRTSNGEDRVALTELRVEPALLSFFCHELNRERLKSTPPRISAELVEQSRTSTLEAFYEQCMHGRSATLREFVEDQLLTVSGDRDSEALDNALATPGVTLQDITALVDLRLLRVEDREGGKRVELTHDVLTDVVRTSRDRRQQREALERAQRQAEEEQRRRREAERREAEKRRQLRLTMGLLGATLVALGFAVFFWLRAAHTLAVSNYHDGLIQLRDGQSRNGLAQLAHGLRIVPGVDLERTGVFDTLQTALFTGLLYTEWPAAILPHLDDVTFAGFSPDGTRVLTASVDRTARLWDAHTGAPVSPPLKNSGAVRCAAFNSDGTRIVTGSDDGTARLWSNTGTPLGELIGHANSIEAVAFSPDGPRIATASADGTARLWDASTGARVGDPLAHAPKRPVRSVAFSRDGTRLVTASADGTARLWNADTGAPTAPPLLHVACDGGRSPVDSAGFSPDGRRVITISDRTVRFWNADAATPVGEPIVHNGRVHWATFDAEGKRLLTAAADGTANVFDVETHARLAPLVGHGAAVRSAVFSHDGGRILTASEDGTARLWQAETGTAMGSPLHHEGPVWSATFSGSDDLIVTASADHAAKLWRAQPGAALGHPLRHPTAVWSAAYNPTATQVLTASEDGVARLWDATTGAAIGDLVAHDGASLYVAAFSPDGSRIVTAATDGKVRLWDAATRTLIRVVGSQDGAVRSAAFSSDGRLVVTASEDGTAVVWDPNSTAAAPLGEPLRHGDLVRSAAFRADGALIVTASGDRAHLWDARTRTELAGEFLTHDVAVYSAAFSPDGTRVVTASEDCTARVWDLQTRAPIGEPLRHRSAVRGPTACVVRSAAFSPDGQLVVTASADGTARLWDAHTGTPVGEPLQHDDLVWSAVFSPDGSRIVTASEDRTARLWEVSPGPMRPQDLVAFAEAVAGRRADDDAGAIVELPDRAQRLQRLCARAVEPRPAEPLTFAGLMHWFCADRATRTVSPRSPMTGRDYQAITQPHAGAP